MRCNGINQSVNSPILSQSLLILVLLEASGWDGDRTSKRQLSFKMVHHDKWDWNWKELQIICEMIFSISIEGKKKINSNIYNSLGKGMAAERAEFQDVRLPGPAQTGPPSILLIEKFHEQFSPEKSSSPSWGFLNRRCSRQSFAWACQICCQSSTTK